MQPNTPRLIIHWGILAGVVLLIFGGTLMLNDHDEFGLFNMAFGAFFIWQGVRQRERMTRTQQDLVGASARAERANQLLQEGKTPDQVAEAFEREFQLPPVQTLVFLALDQLHLIGRGQDLERALPATVWLESGKVAVLPEPADLIPGLDFRKNVFASSPDVELRHEEGQAPSGEGLLVATRTHLLYFASGHTESLAGETAKEMWMHIFPPVIGVASLAKDMVQGVRAELKGSGFGPEIQKQLVRQLAHPASFAVPWREVTGVAKEEIPAKGPPRMGLVVSHGSADQPTVRHLRKGLGLDEEWLDNWMDVVRICTALEGKLLLF